MRQPSIPDEVLEKIASHRPHMRQVVENLRSFPSQAAQIEKAIADGYLRGETQLSAEETWKLAACAHGRPYGG